MMSSRRDFFFYGTLMDEDVLTRVIGVAVRVLVCEPATIDDYERFFVTGETYPVLLPRPGARVEGIVVRGLDARQADRLVRYEADFYDLIEVSVSTTDGIAQAAMTFLPQSGVRASRRIWRYDEWERRHKRQFLRRIDRWFDG
jgi:gamma-glutamylcyclotransferase (GGCT)/AIG2-like uncharacterized protein YtfP